MTDTLKPLSPRGIELVVSRMPGWTLDPDGLRKEFVYASADEAARFAGIFTRRAAKFDHPLALSMNGPKLKILIPSAGDKLDRVDFQFARRLEVMPGAAAA